MRLLFDTNVVLDVLLDRQPHSPSAVSVFALVEEGVVEGMLGATTVTTIYYIAEKHAGRVLAHDHMKTLLLLFEVAEVAKSTLLGALESGFPDFEDAVLHKAGIDAGVNGVVTRDRAGFRDSELPIFTPTELLAALSSTSATQDD